MTTTMTAITALLATALAAAAPQEAAAATCVRRDGAVIIRPACKRAERAFPAAALSPAGGDGPAGAPGVPERYPLAIVDATGRDVGPVVSFELVLLGDGTLFVVLLSSPALPGTIPFAVHPDGVTNYGQGDGIPYYEDATCTGTPYLADGGTAGYGQVQGTAAYYATGEVRTIAVQSYETVPSPNVFCLITQLTDRGTCCHGQTTSMPARPAARVAIDQLGITPPLRAVVVGGASQ